MYSIMSIGDNMDFHILVNKTHPINKDFVPENLVDTHSKIEHLDPNHKVMLIKEVYDAFIKLANDAPFEMIVDSGYRSYEYQQEILDDYLEKLGEKAYETVALPGMSEHQTGLAIDYAFIIDGEYNDCFDDYPEYVKWVMDNCHKYGFILRYPKGKEHITGYSYEPWHIRYLGELAKDVYESGLTYEEYLER